MKTSSLVVRSALVGASVSVLALAAPAFAVDGVFAIDVTQVSAASSAVVAGLIVVGGAVMAVIMGLFGFRMAPWAVQQLLRMFRIKSA